MADQPKSGITVAREAPGTNSNKGFQSPEALVKATTPPAEDDTPVAAQAEEAAADPMMRGVKVRSRTFIPPFRFGQKTLSLPANKECIIPLAAKLHLEEKGLL